MREGVLAGGSVNPDMSIISDYIIIVLSRGIYA